MGPNRSIVVLGAGAVGSYLGATLSHRSRDSVPLADVTLVGRSSVAASVESHGLILRENEHSLVTHPRAIDSTANSPSADLVILAVRAYDVEAAIPQVRELMGETGRVIAMQNGVGSEELLGDRVPVERVLVGTLTVSVGMEEPGIVSRYSRKGGLALATMDGSPLPAWVGEVMRSTGLPTILVRDYRRLRWSKLLLNMLGAATTAILDIDMPAMVGNPALFRIEQLAFREATRVMDTLGVRAAALPGYPAPLACLAMGLPVPLARGLIGPSLGRARGGRAPGSRRDMRRGKTEIEYLNGAVVKAGRESGVPTPVNAALTELIARLIGNENHRSELRSRPEKLLAYMKERGVSL